MLKDGIQRFVFLRRTPARTLRRAEMCCGRNSSSSSPARLSLLMNPEIMKVASIAARIRNIRLLAETKAIRATINSVAVYARPVRVTCCRNRGGHSDLLRSQDCSEATTMALVYPHHVRKLRSHVYLLFRELLPTTCCPTSPGYLELPFGKSAFSGSYSLRSRPSYETRIRR